LLVAQQGDSGRCIQAIFTVVQLDRIGAGAIGALYQLPMDLFKQRIDAASGKDLAKTTRSLVPAGASGLAADSV